MTIRDRELQRVLDYILNRAGPAEIEVLESAIRRKAGGMPRGGLDSIDFQKMAKEMTADLAAKFSPADTHGMTRRLVTNMILEQMPEISAAELEVLLDQWVPDPRKAREGKEKELPVDALIAMVRQFVDYSLGRMPDAEVRELKRSMPDWTERYWGVFSQETRLAIRDLLNGKLDLDEFYKKIRSHAGQG